jgi:hypothetical protein
MSDASGSSREAMPIELAREIARQGDARLSALLALATAADLRATTFRGILGASSIGAGAAVLAVLVSEDRSMSLVAGGSVLAFGLFLGAIFAAWAGVPRDFYLGGGTPDALRAWAWSGDRWRGESEMLDASAFRYAKSIAANDSLLRSNGRWMKRALLIAVVTPFASIAAFLAESCAILPL